MAKQETSNQEVSVALELLSNTLMEEKQRIYDAGAEAMKQQDSKTARSVLDFADKLEEFRSNVQSLVANWNSLVEIRDTSTPAVQQIVTGEGRLFSTKLRKVPGGFTRTIDHPLAPKTNFEIRFPDGTFFSESLAYDTFIKAIQKIGIKQVFELGLISMGEPLVSNTQSKKYPRASKKVPGGYYILTHSSTALKVDYLKKIKKLLGLDFEIQTQNSAKITSRGIDSHGKNKNNR